MLRQMEDTPVFC